ncbi:hypothetical protein Tco_1299561 [Tanacetum coccineum]
MRHFRGTSSSNLDPVIVQRLIGFLDEHNKLVRLFWTARDKCACQFVPNFKIWLYTVVGAREYNLPTSQTLGESSIPVSTIATPPNTSETMQAANTGHLDKTEKTTTKRPKTLKRTLFPSEPQDQKKNKID